MTRTSLPPLLALCVLATSRAVAQQPPPKEILARVDSVYANARSYADSGSVDVTFFQASGTRLTSKPFTTYFVRPDRFRFEYTSTYPDGRVSSGIVWKGEGIVQGWSDLYQSRIRTDSSLNMATARATGVSGGSAVTIPSLLMPDQITAYRITRRVVDARRIDDSICWGRDCIRLQGIFLRDSVGGRQVGDTTTVWIDKESYLIRRIDSAHQFADFRTLETKTFFPAINGAIADSLLKLRPPNR